MLSTPLKNINDHMGHMLPVRLDANDKRGRGLAYRQLASGA